jgi:hypothetical protein
VFPQCFVAVAALKISEIECRDRRRRNVLGFERPNSERNIGMLYALLAYHVENDVMSWSAEEDAKVMRDLMEVHQMLAGRFGPAARLGPTIKARTLRGAGADQPLDGPFAETKEQLLGFYVLDVASEDEALDTARELRRVNPSAVYEIRPIRVYRPGSAIPPSEA